MSTASLAQHCHINVMTIKMSTYENSRLVHRPHQQRSRDALAKIVAAAELLLRTKGYAGFSMAALAELSGLSTGNIYRRFRGKSELLQALKEEITARLEQTVAEYLSHGNFPDIASVVHRTMDAAILAFSHDQSLHQILFDTRITDPFIDKIGWDGRTRIFGHYRKVLLPLLSHLPEETAETLARVSFDILTSANVGKIRANNPILNSLSWPALNAEFSAAAIAYLKARMTSAEETLPR